MRKVLLVEDNRADARLVELMLAPQAGWQVVATVGRLEDARTVLAAQDVDVILLDLHLPDSAGSETVNRLVTAFPDRPVVVLSGLEDEEHASAAVKAGAQDYLVKGQFEANLLVRTMRYAIERHEADNQRKAAWRFLNQVLNALPGPIFAKDDDERWIHVNGPLAALLGRPVEDLRNRLESEILTPAQAAVFAGNHLELGEIEETEATLAAADGIQRTVLVRKTAVALPYGRRVVAGALTDISDRANAQSALESAYRELQEAQDTLIQAEKMAALGRLVAGIAHEINTPVGIGLTGATHLAKKTREIGGLLDKNQLHRGELTHYLEVVRETTDLLVANMNRAAELIRSFKQVAVDQTSNERRRFDLGRYLGEVVLSLRPRLKKTRLDVVIDCADGITVDSYPGGLAQILTNLILNSIIHAYDEGAPGRIMLAARKQADDQVELVYADDGRGIPDRHLKKIFDPFFTTRRHAGGSGLGLNIVYNLATQLLHGRIAVESRVGEGTTFTLRFPAVAPATATLSEEEQEP